MEIEDNPEFEALLDYVKRSRGFDFTAYKRSSLMRRVNKRMQMVKVEQYGNYVDYLEVHPDEFTHLFNTILINVTGFFRDASDWEYLKEEVIPRIIQGKKSHESIRAWSAGCASGEEAYSVGILFAEHLGGDQMPERIKIYATDVDEEALTKARHAIYSAKEVEGVPPPLLEKYFEQSPAGYVFNKGLRRAIIFGRHDLIQDAPISRVDLLTCRNTLMYFNTETQSRVLARLHYSIADEGFLFLGRAEMMLTRGNIFAPVDIRRRVFSKVAKTNLRERVMLAAQVGTEEAVNHLAGHLRLRDAAFDVDANASIVVNTAGSLVLANGRARAIFALSGRELGRPLQDLEMSYKPVELRSYIERAYTNGDPVVLRDVQWPAASGDQRYFDVFVTPLEDTGGATLGVKIIFADVTALRRLQDELQQANQEMETANEELQSSNEELETTNEELQSTNEELETTNEELQSTNEELETLNEELQSTNEELETLNEQLRQRSDEVGELNAFLQSIMTSLRLGVVVLDRDLRVIAWNRKAEDLWGLRDDEAVGQNFLNFDIGLPVEELRQHIRDALLDASKNHEVIVDATNRRGRKFQCRVSIARMRGPDADARGVILLMDEQSS